MYRGHIRGIRTLIGTAISLAGLSGIAAPALAQNPPAALPRLPEANPRPVQIDPHLIEIDAKREIRFQPFVLGKDKRGKPIDANAMVTLKNGKKLSAARVAEEVNRLERELNRHGYSLRKKEQNPVISRLRIDYPAMQKDADEPEKGGDDGGPPGGVYKSDPPRRGTFHNEQHWDRCVGSRSTFQICMSAGMELNGEANRFVEAKGNGSLSGAVMGDTFQIVRASASARAPNTGRSRVQVEVRVVGETIYNLNREFDATYHYRHEAARNVDRTVARFTFPVAGIPISVKFGVRGRAGVRCDISLSPLCVNAEAAPFAQASGYAQTSVSVLVADVGARCRLTFVDGSLVLNGKLCVESGDGHAQFVAESRGKVTLRALNGNFELFLCLGGDWLEDWFDIEPQCVTARIFSWGGLSWNRTIFLYRASVPV
ncbi:MAG: hypothetical protein HZB38_12825 [Planctomycetes bacterium]|nr:hypothetical protein [Planctomycetota bacterium]